MIPSRQEFRQFLCLIEDEESEEKCEEVERLFEALDSQDSASSDSSADEKPAPKRQVKAKTKAAKACASRGYATVTGWANVTGWTNM